MTPSFCTILCFILDEENLTNNEQATCELACAFK